MERRAPMNAYYFLFIAVTTIACVISTILYIRDKEAFAFSHRNYWRFIFVPWKVVMFSIAGIGLTLIAPYTGDPTWDYFDAAVMSILCYLSAPWAVGAIYKSARRELPVKQGFVALCVWMFTVSLFYELYLLARDGTYNPLWIPNIFASSSLYAMAGLLANLHWTPERGTIFAFMEKDWPSPIPGPMFRKVMWFALILASLVGLLVLLFLVDIPGYR